MTERYDVVIAGGAAVGSSLAYHLAADPGFGGSVLVVEPDPTYARAASALSAGSIRQQFSQAVNVRASLHGIAFLRAAPDLLAVDGERPDLGLHEGGYLLLATAAGEAVLRANHAVQAAEGAATALLDPAAMAARFPWLGVEGLALGCLGLAGEGWFDGYALTRALRAKARALGVAYRAARVVGVEREGARATAVRLDDGARVALGALAVAAGASGARALAALAGLDLPVVARKRTVFAFAARDPSPARDPSGSGFAGFPLLVDTSGVWCRPEGRGRGAGTDRGAERGFIAGWSPPDADGADEGADFAPDEAQFEEVLWPALAARVPAFETLRRGRAWAGHYDVNPFDHNAFVGRAEGTDNLYLAAGFSGHGLQQAPAVGRGLAELIARGGYEALDLAPLGHARLGAGQRLVERNVI